MVSKSKKIINIYIVFLFAVVWFSYYNQFVFGANRIAGGVVSTGIYFIIYNYFAKLYRAYKIGTYKISEIIFHSSWRSDCRTRCCMWNAAS